jgi:hypothetical protein
VGCLENGRSSYLIKRIRKLADQNSIVPKKFTVKQELLFYTYSRFPRYLAFSKVFGSLKR